MSLVVGMSFVRADGVVARGLATRPDLLASANPGCTLHITRILRERGAVLEAAHPVEIVDWSIRGCGFRPTDRGDRAARAPGAGTPRVSRR